MYEYFMSIVNEGEELFKEKRYAEALHSFLRAEGASAEWCEPELLIKMGYCFYTLDDFESARKYATKVLDKLPKHLGALHFRGLMNIELKNYIEAEEDFWDFKKLAPNAPNIGAINDLLELCQKMIEEIERRIRRRY